MTGVRTSFCGFFFPPLMIFYLVVRGWTRRWPPQFLKIRVCERCGRSRRSTALLLSLPLLAYHARLPSQKYQQVRSKNYAQQCTHRHSCRLHVDNAWHPFERSDWDNAGFVARVLMVTNRSWPWALYWIGSVGHWIQLHFWVYLSNLLSTIEEDFLFDVFLTYIPLIRFRCMKRRISDRPRSASRLFFSLLRSSFHRWYETIIVAFLFLFPLGFPFLSLFLFLLLSLLSFASVFLSFSFSFSFPSCHSLLFLSVISFSL